MYRSLWIDDEVAALRDMARKFFDTEGAPNRDRWEQQQHVDREFWLKAAKLGLLCARQMFLRLRLCRYRLPLCW